MEEIRTNHLYTMKLKILGFFKTDNVIIDSILSVIAMSVVGYIMNYIYDNRIDNLLTKLTIDNIVHVLKQCGIILLKISKTIRQFIK